MNVLINNDELRKKENENFYESQSLTVCSDHRNSRILCLNRFADWSLQHLDFYPALKVFKLGAADDLSEAAKAR